MFVNLSELKDIHDENTYHGKITAGGKAQQATQIRNPGFYA